jgi:hypothetical protein
LTSDPGVDFLFPRSNLPSSERKVVMNHLVSSEKKAAKESQACTHSRMIDDVYDQDGLPTGKMQCSECMAVLDTPLKSGEHAND